jgi:hypothetical protein
MRCLFTTVLTLLCSVSAIADGREFSKVAKASLVFADDFDATRRYPHILQVILRLDNIHDSDICWVTNVREGIEAELINANGKPLPEATGGGSIQSNSYAYLLPFGSRLDWLISHDSISLMDDPKDKYLLAIGSRAWLIPIDTVGLYSLRLKLRGLPWDRTAKNVDTSQLKLLFDVQPTKVKITK